MEYTIKKEQYEIEMVMTNGVTLCGKVFLDSSQVRPGTHMSVGELLEGDDRFVPMTTPEGEFIVLQKESIVSVSLAANWELQFLKDPGPEAFIIKDIQVFLVNESHFSGKLYIEPIEGLSRVSDQLNRTQKFLTIHVGDRAMLLNTHHITHVKLGS